MKNKYKLLSNNNYKYQKLKLKLTNNINNIRFITHNLFKLNIKSFFVLILILLIKLQIFKDKGSYNFKKDNKNEATRDNISTHKLWFNKTLVKNEMHSYGLYKIFKIPFMSLILKTNKNDSGNIIQIINQIRFIISQNFTNIEILLFIEKSERKKYFLIKKEFKESINDNILKIINIKNNKKNFYSFALNLVKGLYTIFINNLHSHENLKLDYFYNYTKGKIENYFFFEFQKESNLYLIKSKILKNLIDNGIEFNSFNMIINSIKSIHNPNFNYIYISLCPNNDFTNLAYVAISSILSSKDIFTSICFFLITPANFENKNKNFIYTLYTEYDYFNITFIEIDNRYDKAYTDHRITKEAYYRFSLGELLPTLNKIIYLDTDVIVYKDLNKFYNLNFNGKMILGQPSYGNKNAEKHGFHRINTGILLLNLYEMRKKKFEKQVLDIIKTRKKFSFHDQTLLNDYFKEYLGIFPPEYHTRPWSNFKEMEIFNKKIGKPFDKDYFYFAHKYPTIRHFLGKYKPRNSNINFIEDWWFFARKSRFYNDKGIAFNQAFNFNP